MSQLDHPIQIERAGASLLPINGHGATTHANTASQQRFSKEGGRIQRGMGNGDRGAIPEALPRHRRR